MASGRQHDLANGCATFPVVFFPTAFVWLVTQDVLACLETGLLMFCGMLIGRYVEPDLDMPQTTRSERKLILNSLFMGYVWRLYWFPYARIMPHRGLSHVPILGTLTRVFWLSPLIGPVLWIFPVTPPWYWHMLLFVALTISDSVHWWMDFMSTRRKQRR